MARELMPRPCRTPGCHRRAPGRRHYCDPCFTTRRRAQYRRSWAKRTGRPQPEENMKYIEAIGQTLDAHRAAQRLAAGQTTLAQRAAETLAEQDEPTVFGVAYYPNRMASDVLFLGVAGADHEALYELAGDVAQALNIAHDSPSLGRRLVLIGPGETEQLLALTRESLARTYPGHTYWIQVERPRGGLQEYGTMPDVIGQPMTSSPNPETTTP